MIAGTGAGDIEQSAGFGKRFLHIQVFLKSQRRRRDEIVCFGIILVLRILVNKRRYLYAHSDLAVDEKRSFSATALFAA